MCNNKENISDLIELIKTLIPILTFLLGYLFNWWVQKLRLKTRLKNNFRHFKLLISVLNKQIDSWISNLIQTARNQKDYKKGILTNEVPDSAVSRLSTVDFSEILRYSDWIERIKNNDAYVGTIISKIEYFKSIFATYSDFQKDLLNTYNRLIDTWNNSFFELESLVDMFKVSNNNAGITRGTDKFLDGLNDLIELNKPKNGLVYDLDKLADSFLPQANNFTTRFPMDSRTIEVRGLLRKLTDSYLQMTKIRNDNYKNLIENAKQMSKIRVDLNIAVESLTKPNTRS